MDGVIYDSMPNHAVSWHDSMATFGLEMPYDGAYRYEGMRGVETIKLLARQQWGRELSDEEAHRMYEVKSAYFNRQPAPQLMEGIRTLMQQIKADGLKICLVTGSGQHTLLDKILADLHGLLTPELMVTAFDVTHGKPAPTLTSRGCRSVVSNLGRPSWSRMHHWGYVPLLPHSALLLLSTLVRCPMPSWPTKGPTSSCRPSCS